MRNLRVFLVGLLLTAMLVAAAYLWLDRPISYFAHNSFTGVRIFADLTRIPELMTIAAALVFAAIGLIVLIGRQPFKRSASVLLLCGISIAVSTLIKEQLKFVFGRTWPETWIHNNPSLIRDGVYGFNFFHGGSGYTSFPSGHTTVTCAVAAVLWISLPRYRPVWAAMVVAVAIGLIGANYHFLSDVIAGGFIGASTGWIAVLLWDAGGLPRVGRQLS